MLPSAIMLLKQSLEIYKKRFWTILAIVIVPLFAPSLLVSTLFPLKIKIGHLGVESFSSMGLGLLMIIFLLTLTSAILHLWSQVALIYVIKDREKNIGVKESFRQGWNKIGSSFWVYLLSDFIIIGGLFLFFVPGLIFLVWFIFAPFALIVENKKGFPALLASKEYVRGNWLSVFWRLLIITVLMWVVFWAISLVAGFIGIGNVSRIKLYVSYVLFTPFSIIYLLLIYENLKSLKNSNDVKKSESEQKK